MSITAVALLRRCTHGAVFCMRLVYGAFDRRIESPKQKATVYGGQFPSAIRWFWLCGTLGSPCILAQRADIKLGLPREKSYFSPLASTLEFRVSAGLTAPLCFMNR